MEQQSKNVAAGGNERIDSKTRSSGTRSFFSTLSICSSLVNLHWSLRSLCFVTAWAGTVQGRVWKYRMSASFNPPRPIGWAYSYKIEKKIVNAFSHTSVGGTLKGNESWDIDRWRQNMPFPLHVATNKCWIEFSSVKPAELANGFSLTKDVSQYEMKKKTTSNPTIAHTTRKLTLEESFFLHYFDKISRGNVYACQCLAKSKPVWLWATRGKRQKCVTKIESFSRSIPFNWTNNPHFVDSSFLGLSIEVYTCDGCRVARNNEYWQTDWKSEFYPFFQSMGQAFTEQFCFSSGDSQQ